MPTSNPFILHTRLSHCAEKTQNIIDICRNLNDICKNLSGIFENINDILSVVSPSAEYEVNGG